VFEIVDRDPDGELLGRLRGTEGLFGPLVPVLPGDSAGGAGRGPALGIGDRAVVAISTDREGRPVARIVKRLGVSAHKILGVFEANPNPRFGGGQVLPSDRKARHPILIEERYREGATDGDLVLVELQQGGRVSGPKRGVVREVVGRIDDPRAASILAMHTHGIPVGFSEAEEAQAANAQPPTLKGRTDLRDLPLITIDPEDARDHDDAVYATPDDARDNPGGHRVYVAIADVAAYVTPGSPLDVGALKRGNSTYFPDRVAPMLPESLSADLCSLREGQDRACLAVEMRFDAEGRKKDHRFVRGLMRSAAKLSYGEAQAAIDGTPNDKTGPLLDPILRPLWAAYACMLKGRTARAPLDLETTEHRIVFGADGRVAGVSRRERFDAHKLIEEMMIQANVCAAETLEAKRQPLVYRIHDRPSEEKIAQLADFLDTVGLKWAKGQSVMPARFNRILDLVRETENAEVVNLVVLRSQAQAVYDPENIGHFGLNLARYAHFTSPIRRYADLIVHRALIRGLALGKDGLSPEEEGRLQEIAAHISMCERRSMAAEREAAERYIASFLADRVGATFTGKIAGVAGAGLFIRLDETQADGFAPVSSLGPEYWHHDAAAHALVGDRTGVRFALGMAVEVRLMEATPVSGGLLIEVLSDPLPPGAEGPRTRPAPRGRGRPGPRGSLPGSMGPSRPGPRGATPKSGKRSGRKRK
jgi:ribonuclease R